MLNPVHFCVIYVHFLVFSFSFYSFSTHLTHFYSPFPSFYIRCPRCSAEITFKTDPKNSDYACEIGAARNFEPQRAEDTANASAAAAREEEEANNPMRALENRTADSRRELDIINSLEDLRSINAMKEKAKSSGDVIEWFNKEKEALEKRQEEDEEEEEIRRIFGRTEDGARLKRLVDDYNDDEEEEKSVKRVAVQQPVQVQVPVNVQPVKKMSAAMLGIKVKPKQG